MEVANPIYDVVFKHLMQDDRAARLLVGEIARLDVASLELRPQERVIVRDGDDGDRLPLTVIRMDFAARVRTANGCLRQVLIELQKAKAPTVVARFRRYLGEQLRDGGGLLDDAGGGAVPISRRGRPGDRHVSEGGSGFAGVLDHIRSVAGSEAGKGRLFERLMRAYFQKDPRLPGSFRRRLAVVRVGGDAIRLRRRRHRHRSRGAGTGRRILRHPVQVLRARHEDIEARHRFLHRRVGAGAVRRVDDRRLRLRMGPNAIKNGFAAHDRGKLIVSCGTGKTCTALRIAGVGGREAFEQRYRRIMRSGAHV